jgi:hypothetical protein
MLFRIDDYRESRKSEDAEDEDVLKMLDELRERRDRLDEAILALSRLAPGEGVKPKVRGKNKRA